MLKYYNSFHCNHFSMIVRPRERSDRAPSSAGSERSERDRTTIRGSGATVRHHQPGASGAMRNIGSEGAKRPKQSERSERRYTHIISRRERSDRAPSSTRSERSERDSTTYLGDEKDLCSAVMRERRATEWEDPRHFMIPLKRTCANKGENRRAGRCHKNKRKNDKSRLWTEHHRSRAQGRACVRAVAREHAKESEWDNISREQQHHERDAPIKYNENYAIANEVERK